MGDNNILCLKDSLLCCWANDGFYLVKRSSVCFNSHYPGGPASAVTRTSELWVLF